MQTRLLIIDPQNDFCDIPGAALPVPGAAVDMQRLAQFMRRSRTTLQDVIVTLDSHASVGIERVSYWQAADGTPVPAFTQITAAEVRAGRYRPRDAAAATAAIEYLDALEAAGRYRLVVWPVHCVIGTWGHNIYDAVATELAAWEHEHVRGAYKVLKGANPTTEQYSAVRAEVPRSDDPLTHTNQALLKRARPADGWLVVAGEAASHCVKATLEHLFEVFDEDEKRRVVLLSDCMSPVVGFEAQAQALFDWARAQGARVLRSTDPLA